MKYSMVIFEPIINNSDLLLIYSLVFFAFSSIPERRTKQDLDNICAMLGHPSGQHKGPSRDFDDTQLSPTYQHNLGSYSGLANKEKTEEGKTCREFTNRSVGGEDGCLFLPVLVMTDDLIRIHHNVLGCCSPVPTDLSVNL